MDKYKFGEFVYNKRKALHLTQEELGYQLGVSNKAVSKWETGETLPDIQLLESLASVLHVTIDELLTQKKPDSEIVYTTNPKLKSMNKALLIVLCLTSVILLIVSASYYNNIKDDNHMQEIKLTTNNFESYYLITPCYKSTIDDDFLQISSSVTFINQDYIPYNQIQISISFVVHYYYHTKIDQIGVISYLNKTVDFSLENPVHSFETTFSPIEELTDFARFSSFEVEYQVTNILGKLIRK